MGLKSLPNFSMSDHLQHTYVVIPAFNEGPVLAAVLKELVGNGYRVILVDDGSTDKTSEIAGSWPVHYLRHRINLGQGAALMTGMAFARELGAGFVVHFDADGQHSMEDIEVLMAPLLGGEADISLGSRFLKKEHRDMVPKGRRGVLRMARWINYAFTGVLLTDAHNGLRALNRRALDSIELQESGRAHATEILREMRKKGLRWEEVPVGINYNEYAREKGTTFWDGFQVLGDLLISKIK